MHSHLHGQPALLNAVRKLERLNPDKFELYFQRKVSTRIDAKNQDIDSLSRSEDSGLAIRLIKDQRAGFSYTTSLDPAAIESAVQTAFEVAAVMPEDQYTDLFSFGSAVYPAIDTLDSKGILVPLSEKMRLAKALEASCRQADSRITGIRAASLGETLYEVHMVDSNGEHLQHQTTLFSASITCKAEADGDSQVGHEYSFSNYLDNLDVSQTARLAAQWATELLGAKSAPTMTCPAVLRNSVVAELVEFLSGSFSAENMDKGRSILTGRKGTGICAEGITIVDDGLMAGGFATSPFDGEGIPSRKTVLVDNGFMSNILYDNYYARKFDAEPTGNASRGLKGPPRIGTTNLYMQAGRKKAEALFDGISQGILITDLMGVHTANPVTGDFSLGASGILIENGKLTRPVRGFAVSGNILELLKRVTDVGNDLRFFGSVGAPSVRVREISVGGT